MIRATVLADSSATVTDSYEYDAFGNEISSTGSTPNVYMYRGEAFDSDLGLYYLRARYYNPLTGRFMSRDPEDPKLIDLNRKPVDPKRLHKYFYAGADPVNFADPTGRDHVEVGLIDSGESEEGLEAYRAYKDVVREACIAVYMDLLPALYVNYSGVSQAILYDVAKDYCYAIIP